MNPNAALREVLVANTALNTATGGRIYGPPGLERSAIGTKAISFFVSESEQSVAGRQTALFDISCWGADVEECWSVYDLLHTALDQVTAVDKTSGHVMVAHETLGGMDVMHDETERPYVGTQYRLEFRRA